MKWSKLFTTQRLNDIAPKSTSSDKIRTSFLRDYDRIIFSGAFRRMQDKTQVFPLPGVIFVHNRLTHSLEVASVGRSLGKIVGNLIVQANPDSDALFKDFYANELGNVISAACLAHDIGNPPFGHSGEEAIRYYFSNLQVDLKRRLQETLTDEEWKDLLNFEGNSNAFRVLTNAYNELASSYNLTFTTLAAIIKYPSDSSSGFQNNGGLISTKKAGFFTSEINTFLTIAALFELPKLSEDKHIYARHPFVYLTEAADDVCYRVIDIEDAHRLGIVSLAEMSQLFLPFFEAETNYNSIENVQAGLAQLRDKNQKAQYLRARWIGLLVDKLAATFVLHEEQLLNGTLNNSLIELLPAHYKLLFDKINAFSIQNIYNHKHVVTIEVAGYNVISGLLDTFIPAILFNHHKKSEKILQLIDMQYGIDVKNRSLYQNIMAVVDFIAGMTDTYAVDLYRKVKGMDISQMK